MIKKLMLILMLLVLGTALLTASVMGQEGATEPAVNATAGGVLKAVDANAATATIAITGGDELVLKLTEQSEIQIGGAPADLTQLAAKVDSQVNVEYQVEAKTVVLISIE